MKIFYLIFTIYLLPLVISLSAIEYRAPQPELFKLDMTKVELGPEERTAIADRIAETCMYFDKHNEATMAYCHKTLSLALLLDLGFKLEVH